jgi:cellulose synthase/poly-beta-1,6-N-acetylglucosamine synthase-like glycosyltransferase
MKGDLTLAIPCRADEPGLTATLESLFAACQHPQLPPRLISELVICINSLKPEETCSPLMAVRDFCARHGVPMEEVWLEPNERPTRDEAQDLILSPLVGEACPEPLDFAQDRLRQREQDGEETGLQHEWTAPPPIPPPQGEREPVLDGRGASTKSPVPSFMVLLTERKGKPPAWNALWRKARGKVVLFCDADVRIESEAVYYLYTRLQRESHLRLVAAREVPVLQDGGTWWSRMGAIPYRFDFGNAGGRLYVLRKDALSSAMPEDLLLEDAWLTVAVGKHRVAKELRARVLFLPPATWRDCFAERVRTEGGKLQLTRAYRVLLAAGPVAQYDWSQFWREIAIGEYPLVACAVGLRALARLWAWLVLTRKGFYALYRPFSSTKGWMLTHK